MRWKADHPAALVAVLGCLVAVAPLVLASTAQAGVAPRGECAANSNNAGCDVWFALRCADVANADVTDCIEPRKQEFESHCDAKPKRGEPNDDAGWEDFCSGERGRRQEVLREDNGVVNGQDPHAGHQRQPGDTDDVWGSSPSCATRQTFRSEVFYQGDLTAQEQQNCKSSGTPWRPHKIENYGLDNFTNPKLDPGTWFANGMQWLILGLWTFGIFILNGAFALLEWAFHLDLVGSSMPSIKHTMRDLHEHVLGKPWMLVALYVTGLWGIWNGLLRRRFMQTAGGLAVTVLLMAAAMVVIYRPDDTIGELSKDVNKVTASFMGIATDGGLDHPEASVAEGIGDMFEATVTPTWCVLQFGSTAFCDRKIDAGAASKAGDDHKLSASPDLVSVGRQLLDPGNPHVHIEGAVPDPAKFAKAVQGKTVKDAYLQYPAKSGERQALTDAIERMDPGRTRLIGGDGGDHAPPGISEGVMSRLGLLCLSMITFPIVIILILSIGFRIVMSSVMVLVLLIGLPIMLLVTAFGEAGRKAFGTYAQRLGAALIVKTLYSLVLAVTVLMTNVIMGLG